MEEIINYISSTIEHIAEGHKLDIDITKIDPKKLVVISYTKTGIKEKYILINSNSTVMFVVTTDLVAVGSNDLRKEYMITAYTANMFHRCLKSNENN